MSSKVEQIVIEELAKFGVERQSEVYQYSEDNCLTTLTFHPRYEQVEEGLHIVSIAEIESRFGHDQIPAQSLELIDKLNTRSVYGAFYIKDGYLHQKAQFTIYAEEPAAEMVATLILQAYGAQQAFGVNEARSRSSNDILKQCRANLGLPRTWENHITLEEFQDSADYFTSVGLLSTAGNNGITLEVPLSGNIPSRIADPSAQTALLQVVTNVPHPIIGAGYLSTITLPINPDKSLVAKFTQALNYLEMQQGDFVPRFGAWGGRILGSDLVYSLFLPMNNRYGDLHQTMMNWNIKRTLWLRDNYWDSNLGVLIPENICNEARE